MRAVRSMQYPSRRKGETWGCSALAGLERVLAWRAATAIDELARQVPWCLTLGAAASGRLGLSC